MDDERTVGAVIGAAIRAARQKSGVSQEAIARAARACGLTTWTRGVVAALETGRREVEVGEFLLLPEVLAMALPGYRNVSDLLELGAGSTGRVRLGPDVVVEAEVLPNLVVSPKSMAPVIDMPAVRKVLSGEAGAETLRPYRKWWPNAPNGVLDVGLDRLGELEGRTAEKLGIPPVGVAVLARRLWGRPLGEERERRLAATPSDDPGRTRTLRGHVTRQLMAELREAVRLVEEGGAQS